MSKESSRSLGRRNAADYRTCGHSRPGLQPLVRYVSGLLLTYILAGCGGGTANSIPLPDGPPPPPSQSPPPLAQGWGGRFVGTVTINNTKYFGDALLTSDGAVRLYVGGPYDDSGALQQSKPGGSAQFVGNVNVQGYQASGSGLIIAQECASPHEPLVACGSNAYGEIDISQASLSSGDIQGQIRVDANDTLSTWTLNLSPWNNYYVLPARPEDVAGQYQEELAEFALDGDTSLNVDRAGNVFLQSAQSSCSGNGTLTPHLDGTFNVYDVALTIEGCSEPYAYLNGKFAGLATTTPSDYWAYDSLLRVWLSNPDGAPTPVAVTMLGRPL